jgi:hypothetical protein
MQTHRRGSDGRRYFTAEFKQEQLARVARQELTFAELSTELRRRELKSTVQAPVKPEQGLGHYCLWSLHVERCCQEQNREHKWQQHDLARRRTGE